MTSPNRSCKGSSKVKYRRSRIGFANRKLPEERYQYYTNLSNQKAKEGQSRHHNGLEIELRKTDLYKEQHAIMMKMNTGMPQL